MLALRGARARLTETQKLAAQTAWLTGMLAQVDLKQYPSLEDLLGENKPQQTLAETQAEAVANGRAWIAALSGMNK